MYKTKTITLENQWTDGMVIAGFYDYSAQGTSTDSTVVLQRSYDDGVTWEEVDSNISPFSLTGFQAYPVYRDDHFAAPSVKIRLGVPVGSLGTGTLALRIGVK